MHSTFCLTHSQQCSYFSLQVLSAAQIRRGAFNNSGSRDAGKDPHWDFKTGTRRNDPDYEDLFLKDNPQELEHGDRFVYESKTSGGR